MDGFEWYVRLEIDRALKGHPEDVNLRMKVTGEANESRWMSVTPAQVRAIRDLLAGAEPGNDEACPCGRSHTRAEHGYDPDKEG